MRLVCLLILVGVGYGIIAAEPPAPAQLPAVVRQLSDDNFRTRQQAEKELQNFGPSYLPAIRQAREQSQDREAVRRLDATLQRLTLQRLREPTTITLSGRGQTPAEAFRHLAEQSGYKLRTAGLDGTSQRYDFQLENVPFWQAMDAVCQQAGLSFHIDNNDDIVIYYTDSYDTVVGYVDSTRIRATELESMKTVQLGGLSRSQPHNRSAEFLTLSLSIHAEPKSPIVAFGTPMVLEAADDSGASMVPRRELDSEEENQLLPSFRSLELGTQLLLVRGDKKAESIQRLRARIPVLYLAESPIDLALDDVADAVGQLVRGQSSRLQIDQFREDETGLNVELRIVTDRRNQDFPLDTAGLSQRFELSDAKGRLLPLERIGYGEETGTGLNLQLRFDLTAEEKKPVGPYRLQFRRWDVVEHHLDFELKNIPLP